MKRICFYLLLLAMGSSSMACLQVDRLDTWYLDLTGATVWSVIEKDVRSDSGAAADRETEESMYLTSVRQQAHPLARALGELGAVDIQTRFLRATVPFTVVTDARWKGIDILGQQLIATLGLVGRSTLERQGGGLRWSLVVRDPLSQDASPDEAVQDLTRGIQGLTVVLVRGRFTEAQGFELSADRRVATSAIDETTEARLDNGDAVTFALQWAEQ